MSTSIDDFSMYYDPIGVDLSADVIDLLDSEDDDNEDFSTNDECTGRGQLKLMLPVDLQFHPRQPPTTKSKAVHNRNNTAQRSTLAKRPTSRLEKNALTSHISTGTESISFVEKRGNINLQDDNPFPSEVELINKSLDHQQRNPSKEQENLSIEKEILSEEQEKLRKKQEILSDMHKKLENLNEKLEYLRKKHENLRKKQENVEAKQENLNKTLTNRLTKNKGFINASTHKDLRENKKTHLSKSPITNDTHCSDIQHHYDSKQQQLDRKARNKEVVCTDISTTTCLDIPACFDVVDLDSDDNGQSNATSASLPSFHTVGGTMKKPTVEMRTQMENSMQISELAHTNRNKQQQAFDHSSHQRTRNVRLQQQKLQQQQHNSQHSSYMNETGYEQHSKFPLCSAPHDITSYSSNVGAKRDERYRNHQSWAEWTDGCDKHRSRTCSVHQRYHSSKSNDYSSTVDGLGPCQQDLGPPRNPPEHFHDSHDQNVSSLNQSNRSFWINTMYSDDKRSSWNCERHNQYPELDMNTRSDELYFITKSKNSVLGPDHLRQCHNMENENVHFRSHVTQVSTSLCPSTRNLGSEQGLRKVRPNSSPSIGGNFLLDPKISIAYDQPINDIQSEIERPYITIVNQYLATEAMNPNIERHQDCQNKYRFNNNPKLPKNKRNYSQFIQTQRDFQPKKVLHASELGHKSFYETLDESRMVCRKERKKCKKMKPNKVFNVSEPVSLASRTQPSTHEKIVMSDLNDVNDSKTLNNCQQEPSASELHKPEKLQKPESVVFHQDADMRFDRSRPLPQMESYIGADSIFIRNHPLSKDLDDTLKTTLQSKQRHDSVDHHNEFSLLETVTMSSQNDSRVNSWANFINSSHPKHIESLATEGEKMWTLSPSPSTSADKEHSCNSIIQGKALEQTLSADINSKSFIDLVAKDTGEVQRPSGVKTSNYHKANQRNDGSHSHQDQEACDNAHNYNSFVLIDYIETSIDGQENRPSLQNRTPIEMISNRNMSENIPMDRNFSAKTIGDQIDILHVETNKNNDCAVIGYQSFVNDECLLGARYIQDNAKNSNEMHEETENFQEFKSVTHKNILTMNINQTILRRKEEAQKKTSEQKRYEYENLIGFDLNIKVPDPIKTQQSSEIDIQFVRSCPTKLDCIQSHQSIAQPAVSLDIPSKLDKLADKSNNELEICQEINSEIQMLNSCDTMQETISERRQEQDENKKRKIVQASLPFNDTSDPIFNADINRQSCKETVTIYKETFKLDYSKPSHTPDLTLKGEKHGEFEDSLGGLLCNKEPYTSVSGKKRDASGSSQICTSNQIFETNLKTEVDADGEGSIRNLQPVKMDHNASSTILDCTKVTVKQLCPHVDELILQVPTSKPVLKEKSKVFGTNTVPREIIRSSSCCEGIGQSEGASNVNTYMFILVDDPSDDDELRPIYDESKYVISLGESVKDDTCNKTQECAVPTPDPNLESAACVDEERNMGTTFVKTPRFRPIPPKKLHTINARKKILNLPTENISHPIPAIPSDTGKNRLNTATFEAPGGIRLTKKSRMVFPISRTNKTNDKTNAANITHQCQHNNLCDRKKSHKLRQEQLLELQEQLLRQAAEKVRATPGPLFEVVNDRTRLVARVNGPPVIRAPLPDIVELFPEHWTWKDPFACLGLPQKASKGQTRSQYRILARLYHPDKAKQLFCPAKFHAVSKAYQTICNID